MPSTVTLSQLKTRALDRADMTGSAFIDDSRLTDYINAELSELYDLLVIAYEDYFTVTATVSLTANTESYNLPSDLYKLRAVFLKEGAKRYELVPFNLSELSIDDPYSDIVRRGDRNMRYRMLGSKLYLHPAPSASGTLELFYVPEFTLLVNSGDAISFSVPVGWEDFVVSGAAARCLIREESDPSPLLAEKESARARIMHAAKHRDAGRPHYITDVYRRFDFPRMPR